MMEVICITQKNMAKAVKKAALVLKSGGIVAYPTDTAYGLAVNAFNANAIEKIFIFKKRPESNPIHLVVKNVDSVGKIALLNKQQCAILNHWLPGAVTFILKRKAIVPDTLVANRGTVGVRIPNHPLTRLLSRQVPFPYTATSANLAGYPAVYHADDLRRDFADSDLLVLNCGQLAPGVISTVVDIVNWPKYKILREGAILAMHIARFLDNFPSSER